MTAGDLAKPLEVSGMEAKIEGRFALTSMGRHRIKSFCRDDLVQACMTEIGRPEKLERRPRKNSIRFPPDRANLTLGIFVTEGGAEIGKRDVASVTVNGKKGGSHSRGQQTDPSPWQETDKGRCCPKTEAFKPVALTLPKRDGAQPGGCLPRVH